MTSSVWKPPRSLFHKSLASIGRYTYPLIQQQTIWHIDSSDILCKGSCYNKSTCSQASSMFSGIKEKLLLNGFRPKGWKYWGESFRILPPLFYLLWNKLVCNNSKEMFLFFLMSEKVVARYWKFSSLGSTSG